MKIANRLEKACGRCQRIVSFVKTGITGSISLLRSYKVPGGGDQLTSVRIEEAKHIRSLATTPEKRFEHLHPFIIELWHIKQDFLEASCHGKQMVKEQLMDFHSS
ncbi:hypothetical protein DPMN_191810 [Dreissena polymorpha]|uniref:DUF6589 domain-containing protein n=1 Tax=Dreissena polymorpha TaxID=45954 RepID=A0A9D3XZ60_DREPO|nr:hypothetical protein DPMN_191810 [Dreissena polymorpha]